MTDWIELTDFTVSCIIGILPEEQASPQPLQIEVAMAVPMEGSGDTGDLDRSVDYARICDQLTFLAHAGSWRLLETLVLVMARHLLAPPTEAEHRAPIEAVRLSLRKPQILGGRAIPGVRLEREASWARPTVRPLAPGVGVEVLAEVEDVGAYRVHLSPGVRWTCPEGVRVQSVGGSSRIAPSRLGASEYLGETTESVHNPGETTATVLAVCRPPLPSPG